MYSLQSFTLFEVFLPWNSSNQVSLKHYDIGVFVIICYLHELIPHTKLPLGVQLDYKLELGDRIPAANCLSTYHIISEQTHMSK